MFKARGSHGLGVGEPAESLSCHSDFGEYIVKAKQVMPGARGCRCRYFAFYCVSCSKDPLPSISHNLCL